MILNTLLPEIPGLGFAEMAIAFYLAFFVGLALGGCPSGSVQGFGPYVYGLLC